MLINQGETENQFFTHCRLLKIFDDLYISSFVLGNDQIVKCIYRQAKRFIGVIDETQKLPILIQNVETEIAKICYQYLSLAVCCDATRTKRILLGWMTGVTESGFPVPTNNYNCTDSAVCYTNIKVSVFCYALDSIFTREQMLTVLSILNCLSLN